MEAASFFEGGADDGQHSEPHSSSSSIGNDSDVSSPEIECCGDSNKCDEPLETMDSLQQFLPIRKGISKFYDGKSKSYTSLAEAACAVSVKEIAKPENAYTRRRKRTSCMTRNLPPRTNTGAITKKSISSCRCRSRSAAALAFAATSYDDFDSSTASARHASCSTSNPMSPPPNRVSTASASSSSHMHDSFSGSQSFSSHDIQNCDTAATLKKST